MTIWNSAEIPICDSNNNFAIDSITIKKYHCTEWNNLPQKIRYECTIEGRILKENYNNYDKAGLEVDLKFIPVGYAATQDPNICYYDFKNPAIGCYEPFGRSVGCITEFETTVFNINENNTVSITTNVYGCYMNAESCLVSTSSEFYNDD